MDRLQVKICMGTACYVMGASELKSVVDNLPEDLAEMVQVTGCNCLGFCREKKYGKAPYVMIGDEIVPAADAEGLLLRIREQLQCRR